jgi:hypothetical protein
MRAQGSKYEAQEVSDSQMLTRLTRTPSPFKAAPRRSNRYRARFSEEGFCWRKRGQIIEIGMVQFRQHFPGFALDYPEIPDQAGVIQPVAQ